MTRAALTLNGQMCTCIARVLLHENIAQDMTARLKTAFEATITGDPMADNTQLGPLIDRANQTRMLGIVERARTEADLILCGTAPGGDLAQGCYVTPSIFRIDDVTHPLVQDELFGPIISIETFADEPEAIAKANATRFGLAASVYTSDLNRAMRMGRKLRSGTVWLNSHNRLLAEVETGGYRESGIGRLHGVEAMNDFLETKHIYYEAEVKTS
jgi:acyl-CoA reductase-like NAD-dependent aldehyde dehydrogenase